MGAPIDHLRRVGEIVDALRALGLAPVLVGGMALVVLGSRRVTRDFDFVVSSRPDRLDAAVGALYGHGLELVSRLDERGDVPSTITSRQVAAIRLRIDAPASAHFFSPASGLRVDLLFDYPMPASRLEQQATPMKIRGHVFHVASREDLLRLKQLARAARAAPGDAEDIAFLEGLADGEP